MERIAIWNTAFLGDVVLTLPLAQTLAINYPQAKVDFYVRRGLASLLNGHPALNAVYEFDKNGTERGLNAFFKTGKAIAERNYDLWISAHPSLRSAGISFLSKAPMRIGYSGQWYSAAYTHKVDRCFGEMDEIERLLRLVIPLELKEITHWPELHVQEKAAQKAELFFKEHVHAPVLGLHPGSVWNTKRWPAEYFSKLGLHAIKSGAQVLLFAGPDEEEVASIVSRHIRDAGVSEESGALLDISGKLDIPELVAFISKLSCYVSNDSGPMHIAWARHVPVTAIFGPTVKEFGFSPHGNKSDVVEIELACRPCGKHGAQKCPKGHHDCMRLLPIAFVWENIKAKLFPNNVF